MRNVVYPFNFVLNIHTGTVTQFPGNKYYHFHVNSTRLLCHFESEKNMMQASVVVGPIVGSCRVDALFFSFSFFLFFFSFPFLFPRSYSPRTRGVLPRHVASTPCETNDTLGGVPRSFPFDLCAHCALPLLPAGCPEGVATIPRFKSRYIMPLTALPLVK